MMKQIRVGYFVSLCAAVVAIITPSSVMAQQGKSQTGTRIPIVRGRSVNMRQLAAEQKLHPTPNDPRYASQLKRYRSIIDAHTPHNPRGRRPAPRPSGAHPPAKPLGADPACGILQTFEGNTPHDPFLFGEPPDTNGAVGRNFVMSTSNFEYQMQDRSGNVLINLTTSAFWQAGGTKIDPAGGFISDDKTFYDAVNDRFVSVILLIGPFSVPTFPSSAVLVAVSRTGDPTGIFDYYSINADTTNVNFTDYPSVGFNKDWIVIQGKYFNNSSFALGDGVLYVVPKQELYNGSIKNEVTFTDTKSFIQQPAQTFDNSIDTEYLAEIWDPGFSFTTNQIRVSTITGNADTPVYTPGSAFVTSKTSWDSPFLAPIAVIDYWHPQTCIYRNGSLYYCNSVSPHDGGFTRTSANFVQFDPSGTIQQQGVIDDPTAINFFVDPSISVNSNQDVVIGYTICQTADPVNPYPTCAFSIQHNGDAAGTFHGPCTYNNGGSNYPGGRWGDYSATMPDPVDDITFWTVQEYCAAGGIGPGQFGTWWAQISAVPPFITLSVAPGTIITGSSAVGTVTLGTAAPIGGATINLSSSDTTVATVPATVPIDAGKKSVTFTVSTGGVSVPSTAVITADYSAHQATATVKVVPYIAAVQFFDFNSFQWKSDHFEPGGVIVFGRVVLSVNAPEGGGQIVGLSSSVPDVDKVTPSITIQAGQQIGFFPIFTTPVAVDTPVVIVASAAGTTQVGVDTVTAPKPIQLTLTPPTVPGGNPSTALVQLDSVAPQGGILLSLASGSPYATVPDTVPVEAGKSSASFTVSTTAVNSNVTANISATYLNSSASGPLLIASEGVSAFAFNPPTVIGGTASTGIVTISTAAPAGGVDVAISTGPPPPGQQWPVTYPPTVHIAQGTVGTFAVQTTAVGADVTVPFRATFGASTKTTTLTVKGSGLVSVIVIPVIMHAGTTTNGGYVFLSGPAPAGGATVTLSASAGTTTPIGTVVIPAGQFRAQFSYTAPANPPPNGFATISATYPVGVTKAAQVKIIP